MAIRSTFVAPVLFIRWVEAVEANNVPEILRELHAAHEGVGNDLVYVAIVPVDCRPPDSAARDALREGTDRAVEMCSSVHVVIEGSGFRRAMMRSISAGLLLATRRGGPGFQIHETVDRALASASKVLDFDSAEVLRRAEAAGILTLASDA